MKDRIPVYPGRIQLVPSPADDDLFVLTRADEPTQVGTPLNKATLLADATAEAVGLEEEDPTVDDALGYLAAHYSRTLSGTAAPGLSTPGKRGDIYVQDSGGGRRYVYVCDAVGEKPYDLGAVWERGSLKSGTATSQDNMDYRIRSDAVAIPAGTKLDIASGFKFALRFLDADRNYTGNVAGRTAAWTADTDYLARIIVNRVTEDTSEVADVDEFASKLTVTQDGRHWTALGSAREVEKEVYFTSSGVFNVPADLRGPVTVRVFGGGAGGGTGSPGYGGGGGYMSVWTGTLTRKKYNVVIGKGGAPGHDGGMSSFGNLIEAYGGAGKDGGSGGGGAYMTAGGSGLYGGGGGGGALSAGGNGGTYGGGGGGGGSASGDVTEFTGGSGKYGTYAASAPISGSGRGTGGAGYAATGAAASSSSGSKGGAGANTDGYSLTYEGAGSAGNGGTRGGGGGGGFGGNGGAGSANTGGGGGGYGADGGAGLLNGGGGGGGFGGRGGAGTQAGGGGGGGYGLSGNGGAGGQPGGIAAGGGAGASGGDGIVIITYTGVEVV